MMLLLLLLNLVLLVEQSLLHLIVIVALTFLREFCGICCRYLLDIASMWRHHVCGHVAVICYEAHMVNTSRTIAL